MVAPWYGQELPREDGGGQGSRRAAVTATGFDGVVLARVCWQLESPERVRVVVEGEIDRDTAPMLRRQLLEALARRPVVCCDLRQTSFLTAAGVQVLAKAHLDAAARGRTVLLAGATGLVERVLRVTGILDVLAVEG
jgi:anti-sigma B factor antagonist